MEFWGSDVCPDCSECREGALQTSPLYGAEHPGHSFLNVLPLVGSDCAPQGSSLLKEKLFFSALESVLLRLQNL